VSLPGRPKGEHRSAQHEGPPVSLSGSPPRHASHPARPPHSQRGAALLTAMIIVTLVVTLAASMVWQQWRAVQVESSERARAQSAWILSGALDWARLILREDSRTGGADHLGEPWAVPLADARLSTFLAVDKDNTDDAPEAFLSGRIVDAQARYNLRNLVDDLGKIVPAEQAVLARLCVNVGLAAEVATGIAEGLRDATVLPNSPAANLNPPLMPRSVEQLVWLGVDEASLQMLAPYLVLLPVRTPVNVNTAPREVLAAVIERLDIGGAEQVLLQRQRTPFKVLEDLKPYIPAVGMLEPSRVAVGSSFFEVRGRLRLSDRVLEESSLVERRGLDIIPLQRQRLNSRDPAS
jgi:general secretion pathway protein K